MKLHELVKRTYLKVLKPLFKIEVLSNKGWEEIDTLNISVSDNMYELQTDNEKLICTGDHILIDENGNEIYAKDSRNINILGKDSIKKITSVKKIKSSDHVIYDLSLKGDNHVFYSNDLLSHNCIIIDEMAFIPKNVINEFFASVMPVISSSKTSKAIIVSTPNGASGLYYDLWQQAISKEKEKNKEGWAPFRIYWWETGGIRDEEWKKQQIASYGMEVWKQEYECDFLTSSTKKLIPDDLTEKYKQRLSEYKIQGITGKKCKIISENEDKIFEFTMWHEFDKNKTYVASGDISEGVGGDNSVLYVWDISDLRNIIMCAKFDSNTVSVVEFAFIIHKILSLYNKPYFIAERNGCSGGALDALRLTYNYPKIVSEGKNGEYGVFSHVQIKGKSCLWAREMIMTECFDFTIYDKDLLDEWTTFAKKESKGYHVIYRAIPPAHDDYIMSFIWLCYMLQPEIIEKYFWVGTTFKSTLGKIYPQIVKPQKEYTFEEINNVTNDPIYKDFLEFKEELMIKFGKSLNLENKQTNNIPQKQNISYDPYFGGQQSQEYTWHQNNIDFPKQPNLNPNNVAPEFFIDFSSGFSF